MAKAGTTAKKPKQKKPEENGTGVMPMPRLAKMTARIPVHHSPRIRIDHNQPAALHDPGRVVGKSEV